ncbi:mitochondrial ubiquitin ligase activator of nfkb 1-A-like [Acanthaster planci]|uniref:RING-type E3 ubiquitin transferase n=1 Tax=Acanthaster planci TaxID=133434 RepID=A0A8B7YDG7_ACAPL|nr:mitochondrial ubiquitin ligase activator of nfkb 1-A-like [Acanthaster planci]XP_022089697.1 mitochondrial ubiquitin ligase activator of nfkb 1-A-like [Acanthaster planci]
MEKLEVVVMAGTAALTGIIAYYWRKEAQFLQQIKDAPHLNLDPNLKALVSEAPDSTIPYAVIEGSVEAIGKPLKSEHATGILGVLQSLICREHKTYWSGSTRLWHDTTRLIRNISRSVPFVIKDNNTAVRVDDPLSASGLDVPIIYDSFEPSSTSLGEHLVSWASGEKTKGFQTVERMLSEGTVLTGIGMLSTSTGSLVLSPPTSANRPYILSDSGFSGIIRDFQSKLNQLKYFLYISGSITALLVALWLFKQYRKYAERREHEMQVERVLQNRVDDGAEGTNIDRAAGGQDNACTICLTNPRDVVLLDCGHISTCARCTRMLQPPHCPICRQRIKRVVPLFHS